MPDYREMQRQMSRAGGGGEPPKHKAKVIPFHAIPDDDNSSAEREHLRFGVHVCALKVCGRSSPVERVDDDGSGRPRPTVVVVGDNLLLAAALDYARRGWPVLPVHSIRDDRCTCGNPDCDRPAKHPLGRLVPHGVKDATTDEDTIRAWWAAAPWANIGVATGRASGIVSLDVDPARGGKNNLDALEREHGALEETPRVDTGSGGEHWYFAHPGGALGSRKDFVPGLELKAEGTYVVAPPSRHASGRKYRWAIRPDEVSPAEMPDWLLELVRAEKPDDGVPPDEMPDKVGELPEDWNERLLRDEHLLGYWTKKKPLNGDDQSMSAYALAIANRLVKEYPDDTDAQRLAILRAFYQAHRRTAALTKLRLTLKKAKDGAPKPAPMPAPAGSAIIRKLEDVKPAKMRWLDPGRIPLGTLTILDGDPGVGKTSIALDYAARVSTGREMPDGKQGDLYGRPAGVVILSAEDDPAITLRPKLEAMHADPNRIALLEGVRVGTHERLPNLADLAAIEDAIRRVDARLVIVDPLMAYLPGTKNAYHDQDMRAVLTPLIKLVGRLGVALLVVRHLTKQTGEPVKVSALYRGGGSIGIAGAARSVLLVAPDPSDPENERRVLARVKGNLSKPPKGLLFRLVASGDDDPAIVRWEGEADEDADDLVRPAGEDEGPGALDEAKAWLPGELQGEANVIYRRAEAVGISRRTLQRAKKALNVPSRRDGATGKWSWYPPGCEPEE